MDTLAERPNGAKKPRVYLGQDKTFKLADLLAKHGQVVDGVYQYNPGWDDHRVHAAIGDPRISVKRIAELRRKNFGPLASEIKAKPIKSAERIAELFQLVGDLAGIAHDLKVRMETLEKVIAP